MFEAGERDRAESSCISLLSMIYDRYDLLVHPQASRFCWHREKQQLYGIVAKSKNGTCPV